MENHNISDTSDPAEASHLRAAAVADAAAMERAGERPPLLINLLQRPDPGEPDSHGVAAAVKPGAYKLIVTVVLAVLVVVMFGGSGIAYVLWRQSEERVAETTPTPVPTSTLEATPTPSLAPTSTPTPTPTLPAAAETVTVPIVTPTADNPQIVTITNGNGVWLRSTPDSSSRSNIITWMPKGAQVSVDSVGDFWWHGTYKGQAGYFASKYTE